MAVEVRMQNLSKSKIIGKWLKKRRLIIGLTFLFVLDYWGITWLMQQDLSAVKYSTFLLICMSTLIGLWDIRNEIKRYDSLLNVYKNKHYHVEDLPEPKDLIEESYQTIIRGLFEEVYQTNQEAERKAEEAKDYYTLWTHQIKTPIAGMRLILQNRKCEGSYDGAGEELILEGELFKIEQYVEMALQYLRLESLNQDLVLKSYALYDIVSHALQKYAICFMSKKLSIEVESFPNIVVTDEKWLQFVVEQIISNSIKYTFNGGITIKMKDEYTLEISDTGIGIQKEDLPRIFERGFTGFNGRCDHKSTGIGLYLCKKVMNKLGHSLEVESTVGKGTSFYVGFTKEQLESKD